MATDMTVSKTILAQLGGQRFIAMTGANSFTGSTSTLTFRLPKNSKGVKGVRITLDPTDTYTVEFLAMRKFEVVMLAKCEGVYCDMLREVFTDNTGLATSL